MPITEGPFIDQRTGFVRALIEWVKDDEAGQAPYRAAHEQRLAAEARRERMRAIARLKRGRKPGTRPWQAAGFARRQDWIDAGSPDPVTRKEP